jgi:hypothetical protein
VLFLCGQKRPESVWILGQLVRPDNASNRLFNVPVSAAAIADVVSQLQVFPIEFATSGRWQNMIERRCHGQRPTLGYIYRQAAKMTGETISFGNHDR